MAPLYKRYIPPKPGAANGTAASAPSVADSAPPPEPAAKVAQQEEPHKRKRERTDEEVAERKAKKLRKKGIDPSTVDQPAKAVERATLSQPAAHDETTGTNGIHGHAAEANEPAAQGDFAHIKNAKKRHKLEKEARKARIAAEKQARAEGAAEGPQDVDSGSAVNEAEDRAPSQPVESTVDVKTDLGAEDGVDAKKRRKKRRKDAEAEREAELSPVANDVDAAATAQNAEDVQEEPSGLPNEDSQYDQSLSRPKKRRHKLEAAFRQSPDEEPRDAQDEDDTEHLRKHGSIMGKFQKSQKHTETVPAVVAGAEDEPQRPQPILRDLVPLPQPEKAPTPEFVPDPNALPSWLAKPTVVTDDHRSAFADLGLDARLTQHLSQLGFNDALAIQQALIPSLLPPGTPGARYLPGTERALPDVAVGAPTGSGKTIAYLLPIIEALKKRAGSGHLKALVVVPTRELVMQVAAVGESLAKGSRVKIGIATGSGSFADEQAKLTSQGRKYDPGEYRGVMKKAQRLNNPPAEHDDTEGFDDCLFEIEQLEAKEQRFLDDTLPELEDHVPTYESAVDILVATPGRFLEHLDNTLGFSLDHIEWLILDEADKLLDGQYSNFLQVITDELERPRHPGKQDGRERYLRSQRRWRDDVERRVRKVVLSATMTRDVSKLMDLRLKRPEMILVRGKDQAGAQDSVTGAAECDNGFELPPTLREYSVHVGDGSEKPLFLLQVLKEHIIPGADSAERNDVRDSGSSDSDSASHSQGEESSDTTSESSSDSDSSEDSIEADTPDTHAREQPEPALHPSRAAALSSITAPTALIFTSSTESAARLSHLLSTLIPNHLPEAVRPTLLTLTSATSDLRKQLSSTSLSTPVLAITTDRAARGLDALATRTITHVVQYDVPRSATNYVHRVGRTARAGRGGEAWTLFTHPEARWFVNEVVRGDLVRRFGGGVEKVKVVLEDEGLRDAFKRAVEGLRDSVFQGSAKGKAKEKRK